MGTSLAYKKREAAKHFEDARRRISIGLCRVLYCKEPAIKPWQECLYHHAKRNENTRKRREQQIASGRCRYGACPEQIAKESAYCPFHKRFKNGVDRFRNYGITADQFDAMVVDQHGCCAICKQLPSQRWHARSRGQYRSLHVDHDHITGRVRGLLCGFCNLTLGHLEKNAPHFSEMLSYIERHNMFAVDLGR